MNQSINESINQELRTDIHYYITKNQLSKQQLVKKKENNISYINPNYLYDIFFLFSCDSIHIHVTQYPAIKIKNYTFYETYIIRTCSVKCFETNQMNKWMIQFTSFDEKIHSINACRLCVNMSFPWKQSYLFLKKHQENHKKAQDMVCSLITTTTTTTTNTNTKLNADIIQYICSFL
jgi:hypothetical protein